MLKLYFLHTTYYISNMFQFILIILRELLNINKAYMKHRWIIKYIKLVHKTSVDVTKFICRSVELAHKM